MRYEDMINGLAEEMLEKVANEIEMEELEKEAGIKDLAGKVGPAVKGLGAKVGPKVQGLGTKAKGLGAKAEKFAPKGYRNAKANKQLAEKALGGTLDPHNPALLKYKKERNKLIAGGAGAVAGVGAGAGAGVAYKKRKVQEKAASYFEEAEFLKQAAEEAYQEALMMQDAAVALYNNMEE